MKKINPKSLLQITVTSVLTTLAAVGIVYAATTIGANISTSGTLTVGGAFTATSTATFEGNVALGNAASDLITITGTLNSDLNFGQLYSPINVADIEFYDSDGNLTLTAADTSGAVTVTIPATSGTLALTSDLSAYLPLAGGTMTGTLNMGGQNITNAGTIYGAFVGNLTGNVTGTSTGALTLGNIAASDYSTDAERNAALANYLPLAGGTMTGNLDMGGNDITNTGTISGGSINAGTNLIIGGGIPLTGHFSATGTVGNSGAIIASSSCITDTIAVSGAAVGDSVTASPMDAAIEADLIWSAYVSALNTVTVRLCNPTNVDITSADRTWRVDVWKH